jgi:SH3-like domain-containing protein
MRYSLALILVMIGLGNVWASSTSTLSLPRFASLRAKTVNLHVGPGNNYPTEWTFVRQGLPVEIIAEFDTWRQIRDWQGTQGWVHKSLLCGKRMAIIQQKQRKLFKEPEETSCILAHLEPGVLGTLLECRNEWCRLDVQGRKGWVKRRFIWGVYPHENKFK